MIPLDALLELAADFASRNDSAALCLADARALVAKGDTKHARARALTSLRHSVGVMHWAYTLATAAEFVAVNRETGEHVSEPCSYGEALSVAVDWNSSGSTTLFRVLGA